MAFSFAVDGFRYFGFIAQAGIFAWRWYGGGVGGTALVVVVVVVVVAAAAAAAVISAAVISAGASAGAAAVAFPTLLSSSPTTISILGMRISFPLEELSILINVSIGMTTRRFPALCGRRVSTFSVRSPAGPRCFLCW